MVHSICTSILHGKQRPLEDKRNEITSLFFIAKAVFQVHNIIDMDTKRIPGFDESTKRLVSVPISQPRNITSLSS